MLRCFRGMRSWLDSHWPLVDFHTVHITPMWPLTLCIVQLTMCQGQQQSNEQLPQKLCSDNNQTWIGRQCLSLHLQVNCHSLAVIIML